MASEKPDPRAIQDPATMQFTVSRTSLPSLLEWTQRLQTRFKVRIDIQWELSGNVQDTPQVRWVSLHGKEGDCRIAKNYIATFCDPLHKMNVTYPEELNDHLRGSQPYLEKKYSVVLHFLRVSKLLIKSQDEINLMLVLSVIESCASKLEQKSIQELSVMSTPRKPMESTPAGILERHFQEPFLSQDDLETDSETFEQEDTPPAGATSGQEDLFREPLRGNTDNVLLAPKVALLELPASPSRSAISPDRKKIKAAQNDAISPKKKPSKTLIKVISAYDLSSLQECAVKRELRQGKFTRAQVERTLQRIGNNWRCSDLAELIHADRSDRNVPQTVPYNALGPSDHLDNLKEKQESLMLNLEEEVTIVPPRATPTEFLPSSFSTPFKCKPPEDHISILDDTDSVIILSEGEGILTIPDVGDCITIESSEDSDTPEVFYVKGVPQIKTPASRPKASSVQTQGPEALHGVVEGLRQQLKELQDRLETDKMEQRKQFHDQLLEQEKKLKAEQGAQIERQMQEQQQKKQKEDLLRPPTSPGQAIVIDPVRRNKESPLRPIVIDGSNVAMCHGRSRVFSCRGIAICIQYFQRQGHQDITVFVPLGRGTQDPYSRDKPIKDQRILHQLAQQGLLSFTPSRRIGHTYVTCYDDRFIVKLAVENDGVIVSNDNYRDLMGESPKWKFVVENRLVMFTFAGDRFMIPDDPMGRKGPCISQLLKKPPRSKAAEATTHSKLTDGQGPHRLLDKALHEQQVQRFTPAQSSHPLRSSMPVSQLPGVKQITPAQSSYQLGSHMLVPQLPRMQQIVPVVPKAAPHRGTGAPRWGTGSTTGAQLFQKIPPVLLQPRSSFPSPTGTKQLAPTSVSSNTAPFNPKLSPLFETLRVVFPDNETEILSILTNFRDLKDINELSMLVLGEITKSESKK